jgi:multiple sugar transport system substrate-binding protein
MAGTIRESLELAASRPLTAYYSEVLGSFLREFHPPGSVNDETGERTETLTRAVLNGAQLL